jgi:hypothetical protein
MPEPFFGLKFWSDLLSQGLAGMLGAVVGATVAFRFERRKSREELDDRRLREANELSERRAAAGNLAIFTLAKIYSDLWNYRSQIVDPAQDFSEIGARFQLREFDYSAKGILDNEPRRLVRDEQRIGL